MRIEIQDDGEGDIEVGNLTIAPGEKPGPGLYELVPVAEVEGMRAENKRMRKAVDDLLPLAYEAAEWAEDHTEEGDCECACCRIMARARAALEGKASVAEARKKAKGGE